MSTRTSGMTRTGKNCSPRGSAAIFFSCKFDTAVDAQIVDHVCNMVTNEHFDGKICLKL